MASSLMGVAGPFVLLDDARDAAVAAPARLFTAPLAVATAQRAADIEPLLASVRGWTAAGDFAAGFLSYEAGCAFEPCVAAPADNADWPLGWFARFGQCDKIAADALAAMLPDPSGAAVGAPQPTITYDDYAARLATIAEHINAGDIYQANLTFNATVAVHGHPLAIYARLRRHARAGYGGVLFTGRHWLLSFSPELFFSVRDKLVIARPMKGTASRCRDADADAAAANRLLTDPKQRAENLMIVDLLRNDLSRIAQPGTVDVPALFRIETYPTIHQMVSDVTAHMRPDMTPVDALRSMFPCGSITGAPKVRAMDIVTAVESALRGPYTGSVGFVAPDGEAAFNVAIRTLALPDGGPCATLGLGSGIVADSTAADEWRECLAKGEFVRVGQADFDLIETMRFDPRDGVVLLDRHLARLGDSAHIFGFTFDRHAVRNMLQHATFQCDTAARVRLRLSPRGACAIVVDDMPTAPDQPLRIAIAPRPVAPDDIRLRHKTSDRGFYDRLRAQSGAFDTLLTDDAGHVTEGCVTNVFLMRDGRYVTPPLSLGLLPGVLRAEMIESGDAVEGVLTTADLTDGFWVGNALRGLMPARLA